MSNLFTEDYEEEGMVLIASEEFSLIWSAVEKWYKNNIN